MKKSKIVVTVALLSGPAVFLAGWALLYGNNNLSLIDDLTFARRLDTAIENGHRWVEQHQDEILRKKNIALMRILQDINRMHPDPLYDHIVKIFLSRPIVPACWAVLLDPNRPMPPFILNQTIDREYIDNKWILYALAPEKANVTPSQIGLFDPDRWQGRKLTHQLWALIHLRDRHGANKKLDDLTEYLCRRITDSLRSDVAVVDIYIQKVAFVLMAGLPEKINRRWIERIIANQRPDGGWNDRWLILTSRRRPSLSLRQPSSDQHATIQAVWLLYQTKYRCGREFGLQPRTVEKEPMIP